MDPIEAATRGSVFDDQLQPHLGERSSRVAGSISKSHWQEEIQERDRSVLVSLSPHALHYLDLRIAFRMKILHDGGFELRLLLRDHQAPSHPDRTASFSEGRGRLLDVLDLLDVPVDEIEVVTWTDLASRLTLDPDLYSYLTAIDSGEVSRSLSHVEDQFRNVTEAFSTLVDVYAASDPSYHPSGWLIGGPTRYDLQRLGQTAYENAHGEPAVGIIPLPQLPHFPSLPSLLPKADASPGRILQDCRDLDRQALLRMHLGFFALLEEALEWRPEALSRPGAEEPGKLDSDRLAELTADALSQSLEYLVRRSERRGPADHLRVPEPRREQVLEALGKGRRLEILETLINRKDGLEVQQLLDELRLPESKMSTVRRDLKALKEAGLVIEKGLKPIEYHAAADEIEITLGTRS